MATGIDPTVQNFLETTVFPVTDKYRIPRAVAAGQFAQEGRLQGLGASRNNYYNIGAFDSNVNNAYRYASPEDGVRAWANLITGQSGASPAQLAKYGRAVGLLDPADWLGVIKESGYASDPNYDTNIMNTPEYKAYVNQGWGQPNPPQGTTASSYQAAAQQPKSAADPSNFPAPPAQASQQPPLPDLPSSSYLQQKTLGQQISHYLQNGVNGMVDMGVGAMGLFVPKVQAAAPTLRRANTATSPLQSNVNSGGAYTVQPGDTLWGIAQKVLGNGSAYKQLQGYNGSPTQLPIGTKLTYNSPQSQGTPVPPPVQTQANPYKAPPSPISSSYVPGTVSNPNIG